MRSSIWLLIPPALGLWVCFGPLGTATPAAPPATDAATGWPVREFLLGVAVGAFVAAAASAIGRRSRTRRAVEIGQTVALSSSSRVHVLRVDGRTMLVGESRRGLDVLAPSTPVTRNSKETRVVLGNYRALLERAGRKAPP